METRKNEWNKESFLVYDRSLRYPSAPFFDWLQSEGFKMGWNLYPYGHTGANHVYVNITKKLFVCGLNGYRLMAMTGNHAITIKEFKTIYGIYKKYEGKDTFVFNKEPFDSEPDIPDSDGLGKRAKKKAGPKKLYLIALLPHRRYVQYVHELPPSADWKTKHDAEDVLRELDEDFRLLYDFYVVASTEEVNVGDLVDTEKIDICFQII
ncbi:MAG: hypothetical protein IJI78_08690 [Oscillospiraceae bacterium]|nr:hypothetical protein [Oscillospiraceae bacterium]